MPPAISLDMSKIIPNIATENEPIKKEMVIFARKTWLQLHISLWRGKKWFAETKSEDKETNQKPSGMIN